MQLAALRSAAHSEAELKVHGGSGGIGGTGGFYYGREAYLGGQGGDGGSGVRLSGGGFVTNYGAVTGGAGGAGGVEYTSGTGGHGGDGILLSAGGVLINDGVVSGGAGGAGGHSYGLAGASGSGGEGAVLAAGGAMQNTGTIVGGQGAAGQYGYETGGAGGNGGAGVALDAGGALLNRGLIAGGDAGAGGLNRRGHAAKTGMSGAGQASGAVSASFAGFGSYVIGAGGAWSLLGVDALGDGQRLTIDGSLSVGASFTDAAGSLITIDKGGAVRFVGVDETLAGSIVNNGLLSVQAAAVTVTGSVSAFGTVRIDGGTFAAETAFSQAITFAGRSGVLELGASQAFSATISGFSAGGRDRLALDDIGFVNANEASFVGNASGGTLTVSDGTHTARLRLDGDYLGDTFTAASNGRGGVVVTAATSQSSNTHAFVAALAAMGTRPAAPVFTIEQRSQTPWSLTHPAMQ
jgi:hypothetical protein